MQINSSLSTYFPPLKKNPRIGDFFIDLVYLYGHCLYGRMVNFIKIAAMFKFVCATIAIGLCFTAGSQTISRPTSVFEESYGQDGKPMTTKNKVVEGSPMFQEKWFEGKVQLTKGKEFSDALFQFNLATQQLFFKKDSAVFAFTEPLVAFTLNQTQKGKTLSYQFKNGYPAIGKWGSNCISVSYTHLTLPTN